MHSCCILIIAGVCLVGAPVPPGTDDYEQHCLEVD